MKLGCRHRRNYHNTADFKNLGDCENRWIVCSSSAGVVLGNSRVMSDIQTYFDNRPEPWPEQLFTGNIRHSQHNCAPSLLGWSYLQQWKNHKNYTYIHYIAVFTGIFYWKI